MFMATKKPEFDESPLPQKEKSEETQDADLGEIFAAWEFLEHEQHERSKRWYIISALLIIAIFVYAYFDQNPLLAVIVILALITFIIGELRGPGYHTFAITEDGIIVGQRFFAYEDLRNFYIIYQPPDVKMLYLSPRHFFTPRIGIPLEDQDPVAIREILRTFIPEDLEKEDEPTSDYLGRIFKL